MLHRLYIGCGSGLDCMGRAVRWGLWCTARLMTIWFRTGIGQGSCKYKPAVPRRAKASQAGLY